MVSCFNFLFLRFKCIASGSGFGLLTAKALEPLMASLNIEFSVGNFLSVWESCRDHGDTAHGFSVQGWFISILSQLGTWCYDSGSGQWNLVSNLCADVLMPTSGSILNFFPRISSPVACFKKKRKKKFCLSHDASLSFHVVLKDCADPLTKLCTSCFSKCPQWLCQGFTFLMHEHTFLTYPPAPHTGFGKEQKAQFCIKLNWTRFVHQNPRCKDLFLGKILI